MKIAFDVSPLNTAHKNRGVGFYTKNLLDSLKKIRDLEITEFATMSSIKDNVDLVHIPYFDFFYRSLPLKKSFPTVVTIHDATPLVFKDKYPAGIRGGINLLFQKRSLKSCKAVITVSNNAKEDINRLLGISNEDIHVIHSAPAKQFKVINNESSKTSLKKKYSLPDRFALYVGNVNWNKNILNTAQACIEADIDLFLVGAAFSKKENLNHPEMRSFKEFINKYADNPKIHCLGFVEDDDLVLLYNLATLTLFVSFYEGFGFPILESQSCGTPVITSNCSSMPEVAGKGALFVDPYSVKDIKSAIEMINNNKSIRDDLITNGHENIKRFSWDKTAQEVANVYKTVADR